MPYTSTQQGFDRLFWCSGWAGTATGRRSPHRGRQCRRGVFRHRRRIAEYELRDVDGAFLDPKLHGLCTRQAEVSPETQRVHAVAKWFQTSVNLDGSCPKASITASTSLNISASNALMFVSIRLESSARRRRFEITDAPVVLKRPVRGACR